MTKQALQTVIGMAIISDEFRRELLEIGKMRLEDLIGTIPEERVTELERLKGLSPEDIAAIKAAREDRPALDVFGGRIEEFIQ